MCVCVIWGRACDVCNVRGAVCVMYEMLLEEPCVTYEMLLGEPCVMYEMLLEERCV